MNCSVLNVVRLIQVKILAMKTAFACTVSVQTTKRQFGGVVYSVPPPPHVPHTKDHGWIVGEDRQLEINWICGLPAPLAVLELLSAQLISSIRRTRNPKLVPIGRKRTSAQIREINVKKTTVYTHVNGDRPSHIENSKNKKASIISWRICVNFKPCYSKSKRNCCIS